MGRNPQPSNIKVKPYNIEDMNTDMAEYIMLILKARLSILFSWAPKGFTAIQDGLIFHVQGFLLNGWVKIVYNEGTDAFDVSFMNNAKKVIKKVEEVYIDALVETIDYNVEKDGSFDYDKRVKEQYSFYLY